MNPKRILLIEDEDLIRDLFKRQLDLAGFTTDAYPTGADFNKAISENSYDLLLLDIMLPDTNGLELLKAAKAQEKTKNVPVIMLTNLGQDELIKDAFKIGADSYLVKAAYTPDQIVDEVKKVLQNKAQSTTPAPSV